MIFNSEFMASVVGLIFFYNLLFLLENLNKKYPFLYNNLKNKITKLINELENQYRFICVNSPLLLDYHYYTKEIEKEEIKIVEKEKELPKDEKYEEKYIKKFKSFPNEFQFTDLELELEKQEYEKLKNNYEKDRNNVINEIQEKLNKINNIQKIGNFNKNEEDLYTENINEEGINILLQYFDLEEEYNEDPDDIDFEDLYIQILSEKEELLKKMCEEEKSVMTDEQMHLKAREFIINKKLDKYIDNYVLECTPLGNIYMRYNNDKKSFEYFSNNSIPYRYLEPVGRKYVMTYWCKPIFFDLEEELKKAEEKYDENKHKEEEKKRVVDERMKSFKSYNKDSNIRPMKNRPSNNLVLPPQIKAKLPDVNKSPEKQLLKENANRYTWEGRLTNFCPLKKIDRKIIDKKLSMTYAEFKKLQQEQQNKK
jgi:hypothetical protein